MFKGVIELDGNSIRKFDKGDIVLCKKYSVEQRVVIDTHGFRIEPYIDDHWFNRKAYISGTYKQIMDKELGEDFEDRDEYKITFLDDNCSLSWISGNDLILLMKSST